MGAAGRKLRTPRAENHVVWHSRSVPIRKTRADRSSVVARNMGLWPVRPADILSAVLIRVPPQRSGTPLGAGAQTESMCSYSPNPGTPIPPVIFDISELAIAFPCSIACVTPLSTASSQNTTATGSTISSAMLIEITSPAPLATTVIFPPAAWTSTVFSASSDCACAIFSCIFCACFINLLRFIVCSRLSFNFALKHFQRFAHNRRRVLLFCGRCLGRQIFFQRKLQRPLPPTDFLQQCFQKLPIGAGG